MYGLSGIYLEKVEVTRSENLTDMRINVVFGFNHLPSLEINGTYALKGWVGWTELDSNGEQPFSIKMVNATLNAVMHMDLIKAEDLKARRYSIFFVKLKLPNHCNFTNYFQDVHLRKIAQ